MLDVLDVSAVLVDECEVVEVLIEEETAEDDDGALDDSEVECLIDEEYDEDTVEEDGFLELEDILDEDEEAEEEAFEDDLEDDVEEDLVDDFTEDEDLAEEDNSSSTCSCPVLNPVLPKSFIQVNLSETMTFSCRYPLPS